MVLLDPTAEHEQSGRRPVLIVSPLAFNATTKLPVILPITKGGEFARRLGFAVPITGIEITGIIRCDQPRVLDLATRQVRKVDVLPAPIMDEVPGKGLHPLRASRRRLIAASITDRSWS